MKKEMLNLAAVLMISSLTLCVTAFAESADETELQPVTGWTREGYFLDENENLLSVTWMDDDSAVEFTQNGEDVVIKTVPFTYGRDLVVRVAKIVCE